MHFRIAHDFEIPRDALELAFLSPDLVRELHARLRGVRAIQRRHVRVILARVRRVFEREAETLREMATVG